MKAGTWKIALMGVALALSGTGCGLGSAAAASGGGGGGSSNAPTSVANLAVLGPRSSPAEVRFLLRDRDADPATLQILVLAPGDALADAVPAKLVGDPSLTSLVTSRDGIEYSFEWEFAAQLPSGDGLAQDYTLFLSVQGGATTPTAANSLTLDVGNDAPRLVAAAAPSVPEAEEDVELGFTVSDSSKDPVDLRVEYDIEGDAPDAGWQLARPVGLPSGAPTPEFGVSGFVTDEIGRSGTFLWDSDFDLAALEVDVSVRFAADDGLASSPPRATTVFRVDNNDAPVAILSNEQVVLNPDERRGLPVPFSLVDLESDRVEVVLQWRREGGSFPALPDDPAALKAAVRDPLQRRRLQLATELTRDHRGRLGRLLAAADPATQVALGELSVQAGELLARGLAGRSLELLRPRGALLSARQNWTGNPVVDPLAAVSPFEAAAGNAATGDSTRALVLDRPAGDTWRLVELDLARGLVLRTLVDAGLGEASALAVEPDGTSALVAGHLAGDWILYRVDLVAGGATELVRATDGAFATGIVRGLLPHGRNRALATVGARLLSIDLTPGSPAVAVVLDGLSTPFGLVAHPTAPEHVLVAERDGGGGRIIVVDLATGLRTLLVARLAGAPTTIPRPEALAFERASATLWMVTDELVGDGTKELRGLRLSDPERELFVLADGLPDDVGAVGVGPDGLVLVPVPATDDLLVSGGVQQRRRFVSDPLVAGDPLPFDPATLIGTVSTPFVPVPAAGASWRIREAVGAARTNPSGLPSAFVWDTSDVPGGGRVHVRVIPLDTDIGIDSEGASAKSVRGSLDGADPVEVLSAGLVLGGIARADVDGDGFSDLLKADLDDGTVSVYLQDPRTGFGSVPTAVLGNANDTPGARAVVATDFDGDGRVDVAFVSFFTDTVVVFHQKPDMSFPALPDATLGAGVLGAPFDLLAADFDADGRADLAVCSARTGVDSIAIFLQTATGFSAGPDRVIGGPSFVGGPVALASADWNGDGRLDLASANAGSSDITLFLQGAAGFVVAPDATVGGPATNALVSDVVAGDWNADGRLDLASANGAAGTLTVFTQGAAGFATVPDAILSDATMGEPRALAVADWNGDGVLDLAAANAFSDNVTAFLPVEAGEFPAATNLALQNADLDAPERILVADFDEDGRADLATGNFADGNLVVFRQAAPGDFAAAPAALGGPTTTLGASDVTFADFNGDGLLDVATANALGNDLTLWFQSSAAVFPSTASLRLGGPGITQDPRDVVAADLNGDGRLDLVSANRASSNVTVFLQTAAGSFSATPDTTLGGPAVTGGVRSVTCADWNADGRLDLACANELQNDLALFLQNTDGSFPATPIVLGAPGVTDAPAAVRAGDWSGDGRLDVVCANEAGNSVTLFYQANDGSFPATPSLTLTSGLAAPSDLAVGDWNDDGALDLACASPGSDSLVLFLRTATGIDANILAGVPGAASVVAADLNGDGLIDLAGASPATDRVTVFSQTREGRFDGATRSLGDDTTPGPLRLCAGDLDGDGESDLAATVSSSRVVVFFAGH